jgi:hypothetical protein
MRDWPRFPGSSVGDDGPESFLFTITNQRGIRAQRFEIKEDARPGRLSPVDGPAFGSDLCVHGTDFQLSLSHSVSESNFGVAHSNPTYVAGEQIFTGEK